MTSTGIGKRRLGWRDLGTLERSRAQREAAKRRTRPLAADVANPFAPPEPKKRPQRAPLAYWTVRKGPRGGLDVVDREGVPVMEHPDPLRRLEHAHLIASAPELRDALDIIAHRFQRYLVDHHMTYDRDARLCAYALEVLGSAAAPWTEMQQAAESVTPRHRLPRLKAQGVA